MFAQSLGRSVGIAGDHGVEDAQVLLHEWLVFGHLHLDAEHVLAQRQSAASPFEGAEQLAIGAVFHTSNMKIVFQVVHVGGTDIRVSVQTREQPISHGAALHRRSRRSIAREHCGRLHQLAQSHRGAAGARGSSETIVQR